MQDITCYMLKYKKFACHHVFLQGGKLYTRPVFPLEDVYKEGMIYTTRFLKKIVHVHVFSLIMMAHLVRAFASHAERLVFECRLPHT